MWFCEWIIRSRLLDKKNKININPHQPKESHHLTRCLASLNLRSSTNFTKDLFASLAPGTRRSWLAVVVVVRRSSPLEPGWKTSNNPLKLAFNVLLLLLLHICQPGKGNILQRKTQVCEENLACEPTWLITVAWGEDDEGPRMVRAEPAKLGTCCKQASRTTFPNRISINWEREHKALMIVYTFIIASSSLCFCGTGMWNTLEEGLFSGNSRRGLLTFVFEFV